MLIPFGGPAAVHMVLAATGAIQSLDALWGDDLYSLLLELPERDPDGEIATSVYRSLVEAGQLDIGSPRREEFIRRGRMWGTLGAKSSYYPVRQLRYAPRTAVPEPIRQHIPLVAIDPRRNASEVARVFGVAALSPDEYEINIDDLATPRAPWWGRAARQLRAAVPYLYALRLSQRADDRGEEKRAFAEMELVVATRLVATVKLEQRESETVVLDQDLKGLAANRRLYIVSELQSFDSDPVFWRAVADLVADVINVPRAGGDFGSLLSCADDHQRMRLLDHMTESRGAVLLAQARAALELKEPEEDETKPLPPPRPAPKPGPSGGSQTPPPPSGAPIAPAASPPSRPSSPTPICPPTQSPGGTRDIVVTGPAGDGGGGGSSTSLPSEDETLRVAERFEALASPPRFTVRVSHLRGSDGFGCDILSFATQEARDRARDDQVVSLDDVERFIEVKGRTSRTAPVELTNNEREAAVRLGPKYFVYRVFSDPGRPGYQELAVMADPVASLGQRSRTQFWYEFSAGSGAEWYRMPQSNETQVDEVSAPDLEHP